MKKLSILSILVVFVFFIGLFSCKKKAQNSTQITFDSIVVKERIPLLAESDTTLPYSDVDVRFIYPSKFGNKEKLARLQQIFVGTFFGDVEADSLSPQDAMNEYIAAYTEEYKSLSNNYYSDKKHLSNGDIPQWYWYSMSNENKIVFKNDSLLSYAVQYSDYTGGAHGSHRTTYVNIDLGELTTLSEEDIFLPNYQKPLREIIIKKLMADNNVSAPESLINIGFFDIDEIFPNNNFWLNDEGIHYAYNQYEIAPYSMGVIEVLIPFNELKSILKPDVILGKFFVKKEEK